MTSSSADESVLARQLEYWRGELAGVVQPMVLPVDRARPAVASLRGGMVDFELRPGLVAGLEGLARARGVTPSMVLQSVFAVLLSRLGAGEDVVIGSPIAGRTDEALGDLIGFFVNTWVLRVDLSGNPSFDVVLDRVRGKALAAYENQDVPFERLVELLNPDRSRAYHPLFQVMFVLQDGGPVDPAESGWALEPAVTGSAKFDLMLTMNEVRSESGDPTLAGHLEYAVDLFDRETAVELCERFVRVLEQVLTAPGVPVVVVDVLLPSERDFLMPSDGVVTGTGVEGEVTVVSLVAERVASCPGAVAVVGEGGELTYRELDAQASALARRLVTAGVGPDVVVGVALPRSVDLVVALLAVWRAGGAYLPVDPRYPSARLDAVLASARPCLVMVDASTETVVPAGVPLLFVDSAGNPETDAGAVLRGPRPENLAYVMYTSGSTGEPKGVGISQRNVVAVLAELAARAGIGAGSRVLAGTSVAFDVSVFEVFSTLISGGCVEVVRDVLVLGEREGWSGSVISTVPSVFAELLDQIVDRVRVQTLVFAGEALPMSLVNRARAAWPDVRVVNSFGQSETFYDSAFEVPAGAHPDGPVPIGNPLDGVQMYVLGPNLRTVPVGVTGELYVGGDVVGRGYLGRAGLTGSRFIADPYGGSGGRLYRTGDLVRWRPSKPGTAGHGDLEYIGRADIQVKVRGIRIEPAEIEAVLLAHPPVGQAVVVAHGTDSAKQLVAYVVPVRGEGPAVVDVDDLRRHAAARLPEFMVPAITVVLDHFPLTPSGKLDRHALPAPEIANRPYRAPRTRQEEILAEIFAEVLDVERVGIDDDFFALGGQSLRATRLMARVRATLDAEFPIIAIFNSPTVAGLVTHLSAGRTRPPLVALDHPQQVPLSYAQQRLWFIYRYEGPSATYNIPLAARLSGEVDRVVLEAAIADVIARHESLRTLFLEDASGIGYQQVLPPEQVVFELPQIDVAAVDRDAEVTAVVRHCFDLATQIPIHGRLLRIAEDGTGPDRYTYLLVMVVHHIAGDGGSMATFARDLAVAAGARQAGLEPDWAPLPVQYADYTLWQRTLLGEESDPGSLVARQLEYWRGELAGVVQPMVLPVDHARPAVASLRGGMVDFELRPGLVAGLEGLARARGVTPSMVLQSVFAVLLSRLGAGEDVVIGSPIAGRTDEALGDLIGFFVNTWVLRVDLSGNPSFDVVLDRVRGKALAAYENQDVPFERLVELLNPDRSRAYHPLFQVMFVLQDGGPVDPAESGWALEPAVTGSAKFDLMLTMNEVRSESGDPTLAGHLEYAVDLFDRETAVELCERFVRVLEQVLTAPGVPVVVVDVLLPSERDFLMPSDGVVTGTGVEGEVTVVSLVAERVASCPGAVAVVGEGGELTYRELDAQASALARRLVTAGVGPDVVVGVALPRSVDLVVALLAVWRAGGAYLPVDPRYPSARLDAVLASARPCLVMVDASTETVVPAGVPLLFVDSAGNPETDAGAVLRGPRPENLAYVMYTSGSTGEPKGVGISQRNVVAVLAELAARAGIGAGSRVLAGTSVAFDVSVFEVFSTLISGGCVEVVRDVLVLGEREGWSGSVISTVPSVFAELLDQIVDRVRVQTLVFAGEALPMSLVNRARAAWPDVRVVNSFGQSETFYDSAFEVPAGAHPDGPVPIGNPLDGVQMYVLGPGMLPNPVGVTGELYVGGDVVGRGYLGRAGLTGSRFIADPYGGSGGRLYRTGDLVRWRPSKPGTAGHGDLEYIGRADIQVKVRGIRIEPAEIEAVLLAHPMVSAATVVVIDTDNGKRLVGYVVPLRAASSTGTASTGVGTDIEFYAVSIDPRGLRQFVADRLPEFMVPAAFMVLDRMPLTSNGKLDHTALPAPVFEAVRYRTPQTPTEVVIAGIFADVLGLDRVGLDDDFFAVGGDSIRSIQVVARARAAGLNLTAQDVFAHSNVAALAATAGQVTERPVLDELDGGGVGRLPLLPIAHFLLESGPHVSRYTQAMVLELPIGIDPIGLVATLDAVLERHDMLRARLVTDVDGHAELEVDAPGAVAAVALIRRIEIAGDPADPTAVDTIRTEFDAAAERLDPAAGVLLQCVWFDHGLGRRGRLAIVVHHLAVDSVSWQVLVTDFNTGWDRLRLGRSAALAPVGTSARRWSYALRDEAVSAARVAELPRWLATVQGPDPLLGDRALDPAVDVVSTVEHVRVALSIAATEAVLTTVPARFRTGANDGLLTALAIAVAKWRRRRGGSEPTTLLRLEGHGREEAVVAGAELSRTVGWFATLFPVRLDIDGIDLDEALRGGPAAGRAIKAVKEQLLEVPDKGIGYGLLRYLNPETGPALAAHPTGQIAFNYLGRMSGGATPDSRGGAAWWPMPDGDELVPALNADMPVSATIDIGAAVTDGSDGPALRASFGFPANVITRDAVQELADLWIEALTGLARHMADPDAGGLTPSDVPLVSLRQGELEELERAHPGVVDVWRATTMQEGLLFHADLSGPGADVYHLQYVLHLRGAVDAARLRAAGQSLLDRHPNLRAAFVTSRDGTTLSVIRRTVELPWREVDLTVLDAAEAGVAFERLLEADRGLGFHMAEPPMLRMALVAVEPEQYELVLTVHHVLFDGWSLPLLLRHLLWVYAAGEDAGLPRVPGYRDFLMWLSARDRQESVTAWLTELAGVTEPTLLAGPASEPSSGVHEIEQIEQLDVPLPVDTARRISRRATDIGVTLNTVMQGAWALLLATMIGRTDVIFGATVSGRPAELPDVDAMLGLFINTVPVRARCEPGLTLGEYLSDLQARQTALLSHQYIGLTEIYEATGLRSLFDTLMSFDSYPVDQAGIVRANLETGLTLTGLRTISGNNFPMAVVAAADPDLRIHLKFRTDLFSRATVEYIAAQLVRIFEAVAKDPGTRLAAIDLLGPDERARVLQPLADMLVPPRIPAAPEDSAGMLGDLATAGSAVVLGPGLRPVPIGAIGELYLTGGPDTDRHLEQPAVTAMRFVANPLPEVPGGRIYRTGSLVRRIDQGLEYVGRVDAEPATATPDQAPKTEYRAPSNPGEEILAELFGEVLGIDRIGVDDDFFELGGHSLRATWLISRIRSVVGVTVTMRTIFEFPTVARLEPELRNSTVSTRPKLRRMREG